VKAKQNDFSWRLNVLMYRASLTDNLLMFQMTVRELGESVLTSCILMNTSNVRSLFGAQ